MLYELASLVRCLLLGSNMLLVSFYGNMEFAFCNVKDYSHCWCEYHGE